MDVVLMTTRWTTPRAGRRDVALVPSPWRCDAVHRVLGACSGKRNHPLHYGHSNSIGWWDRMPLCTEWRFWSNTTGPGMVCGGVEFHDGRSRVELVDPLPNDGGRRYVMFVDDVEVGLDVFMDCVGAPAWQLVVALEDRSVERVTWPAPILFS